MGGNLFKLGRIPKANYLKIEKQVANYLNQKIGNSNYAIPRYYGDKADFGDLDILINSSQIESWDQLKTDIVTDLNINQYKSIGNVFSTVYSDFQVDFFIKSEPYFKSTYNFLCFNDVGNIIGRIFKRFNLKYGEKGLLYVFRRKTQESYSKEIIVSIDFEKIYSFLELDYKVWKKGFSNRESLFKWVIASPFFSTKPYLENNKSIQRRKQRPTIIAFINFLKDNNITKSPQYLEKEDYLEIIDNYFPEAGLLEAIKKEKDREVYVNVIREKYNGRIIMALFPDLKGKELGRFITAFQAQFHNHEEYFYNALPETIINLLTTFKKEYDIRRT